MSWPLSQDFNEAAQNPATAFGDPDLKGGTIATNAMGVPIPRSGNYADVYQVTAANGQKWAVKCFTRPTSAGLDSRYAAVSEHLNNANLPFTVGFSFLPQGIRVRGQWYPIVKMQWVDGYPINGFVRDNLNRSTILENMLSLWVRLCRRLRETGMAHGDIQHGNVLLVPAEGRGNSLGLKLVDYDGMFVPALANQPSGEAGHPSFQHPERAATGHYSADLDRFPHLVVATALRGLLVGGKALWEKYDTGDNLLFTEKDFKNPGQSKVFKELWETGDPFTVGLVGHLALACTKPIHQTPWLDQLMPGGQPPILTPSQERQAAAIISGTPIVPEVAPQPAPPPYPQYAPPQYAPPQYPPPHYGPPPGAPRPAPVPKPVGFDSQGDGAMEFESGPKRRRKQSNGSMLLPAIIAGVVVLGGIVGGIVMLGGGNKKTPEIAVKPDEKTPEPKPVPKPDEPKPAEIKPEPVKPEPVKPDPMPRPPRAAAGALVWSAPMGDNPQHAGRAGRFSLDGTKILSATQRSGLVDVLDAANGQKVATFRGHEPPATIFPFPLQGGKAMSAGREPVLMAWDLATAKGTARAPLADPKAGLTALQADREGKYAVLIRDGSAGVVDLETGREKFSVTTPKPPFTHFATAILPDGSGFLAITAEHKLRRIALPSGATVSERPLAMPNPGIITAWSPDGKWAAIRELEGTRLGTHVLIVDVATGATVKPLAGSYQIPGAFTLDGRRLALAQNGAVDFYDASSWDKVASATYSPSPNENVTDLDIAPDGSRVLVTTFQRTHYLVSFAAGATAIPNSIPTGPTSAGQLQELASVPHTEPKVPQPEAIAVDRAGTTYYLGGRFGILRIDRATKRVNGAFSPGPGTVRQMVSLDDKSLYVEWSGPNEATQFFTLTDEPEMKPTAPGITTWPGINVPRLGNVAVAAKTVAFTSADGRLAIYDLKTGRQIPAPGLDGPMKSAFLTADGGTLLAHRDGDLVVFDTVKNETVKTVPLDAQRTKTLRIVDISPEGKWVALERESPNKGANFWFGRVDDLNRGASHGSGKPASDYRIRFLADGKAVLANDQQAWIYDTETARRLPAVSLAKPGQTLGIAVGPGGETLALLDPAGATIYQTGVAPPAGLPGAAGGTDSPFDRMAEVVSLATADVNIDAISQWAVDRTGKTLYFATDSAVYPIDLAAKKFTNRYAPSEGRIRRIWATGSGDVVAEVRIPPRRTELHVLDGQMARPTGPGIIKLDLAEYPRSIHVPANGGMAAVTKDNGHVAAVDLRSGKTIYTFHPEPAAIGAFFTADGDRVIANCGQRIHVYPFADRPKFKWFDPTTKFGIAAIVLEDISPDGKLIAFRTPGTDNTGTRFTVASFEGWKPVSTVSSASTGGTVQFRFLSNARAIVNDAVTTSLHDVATGKRLAGGTSPFVTGNSRAVPSPTGEFVLFGASTGVTLYRTTGAAVAAVPAMPAANRRLAVPDAAALLVAEKAVKETFAADFAKKLPADRKKLGERLLADAKGTATDPPAQYYMLREAVAIAVEAQDATTMMKATDSLDEIFEVDGFAMKVAGLETIAKAAAQTTALKAVAESVQELSEELADKDEYEKSIKLAAVAVSCYGRAGATAAGRDLDIRIAQLKKLKDAFESVRPAVEKLKTVPDDAEASTAVGKFRCFQQGRWDEGFKLLANSSDAALKKLAEMELKASSDFEINDANRGDLWWDYAEKAADPDKTAARGRSKYWYGKALVSIKAGLERTNAEKRLSFAAGGAEYRPGLVAEVFFPTGGRKVRGLLVNTLEFAADNADIVPNGGPGTVGMKWIGVVVPPAPGRYKLVADSRDEVRVTMGVKPDEKKIISTVDKGLGNREGYFLFGERPVAIVVEFGGQKRRDHGLILKWIRPGAKSEEVIPASALFHKKDDEKLVTEK